MRIWHQGHTVLDDVPAFIDAMREHYKAIAAPDTTIDMHGMAPGTYPSDYPLTHLEYSYLAVLHKEQFIRAALRAEEEGYDAFFIASSADPALEEARSLVDIPVIALGQGALLVALTLGHPVGVVSFVADIVGPQMRRYASLYGIGRAIGPVVPISVPFHELLAGFEDPTPVVEKFAESARLAIAQGANVLVAAEGPLNIVLARAGVGEVDGVPLVDSHACGIALCEMRSHFHKLTGLSPSESGFYYATPPKEVVLETRERYFGEALGKLGWG